MLRTTLKKMPRRIRTESRISKFQTPDRSSEKKVDQDNARRALLVFATVKYEGISHRRYGSCVFQRHSYSNVEFFEYPYSRNLSEMIAQEPRSFPENHEAHILSLLKQWNASARSAGDLFKIITNHFRSMVAYDPEPPI